ncbi:MAG: hypothetical protein AAF651_02155 [Cyanobacteria bacterium P01_C01_bin.73]
MILLLLTRILLWVAVGLIIWYILLRFIPRTYLTWLGGLLILVLLVISFVDTSSPTVETIWRILSFPLYPLGAAISLMFVALSSGVKKADGNRIAWALIILSITSLPIVGRSLTNYSEGSVQAAFDQRRELCEDVCPAGIPDQVPLNNILAIVVMGDSVDEVNQTAESPNQISRGQPFNVSIQPRLVYASTLHSELTSQNSLPDIYITAGASLGSEDQKRLKDRELEQAVRYGGVDISRFLVRILDTGMAARATAERVKSDLADRERLIDIDNPEPDENRIMLVAPALSIRRIALTFEHLGLNVVARPTDFYSTGDFGNPDQPLARSGDLLVRLSDVVPSVEGLRLTTRFWDEILTTFYYLLQGWLPPYTVSWKELVEI